MNYGEIAEKVERLYPWFGYLQRFGTAYIHFKFEPKRQRTVKCQECGTLIPKDVPRVYIHYSWSSRQGHYCLECAKEQLLYNIKEKKIDFDFLKKNIEELYAVKEAIDKTLQIEDYKEKMSVAKLMARLNGKKDNFDY